MDAVVYDFAIDYDIRRVLNHQEAALESNDRLRVTHIRVANLFGRYTHEVPLRTDDRVTIIHGPNGVGKTVLLRLTAALLSGDMLTLAKTPFQTFEVTLSDGSVLGVERTEIFDNWLMRPEDESPAGVWRLKRGDRVVRKTDLRVTTDAVARLAARVARDAPWLNPIGDTGDFWGDFGEMLTVDEVLERHIASLPLPLLSQWSDELFGVGIFDTPDWMVDIQGRVQVRLIETQRLLRLPGVPVSALRRTKDEETIPLATVEACAHDLQQRLAATLASSAQQSQALDRSFPQRLLHGDLHALSAPELHARLHDLAAKQQRFERLGLTDADPLAASLDTATLEMLDDTRRAVMTLYVQDVERKLGALDDLARRIEKFLDAINRHLIHKSIVVNRHSGLTVVTDQDRPIQLASLSSGEQHQVVLLYDLLFRVQPNTLVLIDEPELSLHLTWQKGFVPDVLEIASMVGCDVVLATHSPFIVDDRHDLMVPLLPERESEEEIDA